MLLCKWDKLPSNMQIEEVKSYWEILRKRNLNLFCKRIFDIIVSLLMLIILLPLFLVLAICIKIDSKGPVFYRQERLTQYGKVFRIHKFRSMFVESDNGSLVTLKNDSRVTKIGKFIRKFKLDELSQLIDILNGNMTFVGARPEVQKFIDLYDKEYLATLLLPAGVTSMASLLFKDENDLLDLSDDYEKVYVNQVLPVKMHYNLEEIVKEGIFHDIKVMFMTLFAICGKKYKVDYQKDN